MKPLTTEQLKRIRTWPQYDGICPTCKGAGGYTLDGADHVCDCEGQLALQRRYFAANIGALYHTLSFGDFFQHGSELSFIISDYIRDFQDNLAYGRGITFHGDLGTGKTYAASLILKELIKLGYNGFFITFDDLLNLQSQGWKDSEYNDDFYVVRNSEVLVIDELFDTTNLKKGELLSETLERIVRYRVSNKMPTIITTNLKPDQEERAYPRVNSLLSTSQIRFHIDGADLRKTKVRSITDNRIARGDRKPIT